MAGNAELALKLREMRSSRSLTLKRLAELTQLTTSFISQAERGLVSPSIDSLRKLAKALDVELVEFFAEDIKTLGSVPAGGGGKISDKETKSSYEEIIFNLRGLNINPLLIRLEKGGEVKKDILREDCAVFATLIEGQAALIFGGDYRTANITIGGGTEISWEREKLLLEKSDSFCCIRGKSPESILNTGGAETVLLWIRSGAGERPN